MRDREGHRHVEGHFFMTDSQYGPGSDNQRGSGSEHGEPGGNPWGRDAQSGPQYGSDQGAPGAYGSPQYGQYGAPSQYYGQHAPHQSGQHQRPPYPGQYGGGYSGGSSSGGYTAIGQQSGGSRRRPRAAAAARVQPVPTTRLWCFAPDGRHVVCSSRGGTPRVAMLPEDSRQRHPPPLPDRLSPRPPGRQGPARTPTPRRCS